MEEEPTEPYLSTDAKKCQDCGTKIPAHAPDGFCPVCLLASAEMASEPNGEGSDSNQNESEQHAPSFAVPIEQLRELFTDLEILDSLGAGGMGAVYRARQPRLDRIVALKILTCPPEYYADFALRFEREAQVLARLNHPNIVTIFDFGELERTEDASTIENVFYFIMEYVDGADLNRLIRTGKLTPEQALKIIPQVCDALQYAHDEGITHRDIKPANILVDQKGDVRIADFGLAKLIGAESDALGSGLTLTGTSMGTPHYMAPEQWETASVVDHRADIYSLGVVFYEMLTGERPMGVFDPPSRKIEIDVRLDEVVLKAMERDVERRYQQASEIREDVTRVTDEPVEPRKVKRRKSSTSSFIAAVLAVAVVIGAALWWKTQSEIEPESVLKNTNLVERAPKVAAQTFLNTTEPISGRLRAEGTLMNGRKIDLSQTVGFDDFVDIHCTQTHWFALRANGDLISSRGIGVTKNVARIGENLSNQDCAFVDRDGKLQFLEKNEVLTIPQSIKDASIVDVAVTDIHGLVLTADGNAIPWGGFYSKAVGDSTDPRAVWSPQWPPAPPEALRNVAAIAVANTHAATIDKLGELRVWGWQGLLELDLSKLGSERFRRVQSCGDLLMLETDNGEVWRLQLPRNPSPEQPVRGAPFFVKIGEGSVERESYFWRSNDDLWQRYEEEKNIFEVRLKKVNRANIPKLGGYQMREWGGSKESRSYIMWIEPIGSESRPTTGKLKASGTFSNGDPIDLSRAAGHEDFVQVHLHQTGWVGLRAGGQTVSSDGRGDRENIRRIFPSAPTLYALQTDSGDIEIVLPKKVSTTSTKDKFPANSLSSEVLDIHFDSTQGIVLTKDGVATVWGNRYDDPDALPDWSPARGKWVSPPAEALKDVVSIGMGTSWAGTVTSDGRLWVWSEGGLIDLGTGESRQGEFTTLYSRDGESGDVRLHDGSMFQLNLAAGTHQFKSSNALEAASAYAFGGYLPFYQTPGGEWISSVPYNKHDPLLKEIKDRGPDEFSLMTSFKGYSEKNEMLADGLITIEPPSLVTHGRLEASGTLGNGDPIDLSRAAEFDDFVQISLHEKGWVALRAGGQTISSDGHGDRQNVRRIFPGAYSLYAIQNDEGDIEIVLPDGLSSTSIRDEFPSDLPSADVIDLQFGTTHGIVLTKNGKARVWGDRYNNPDALPEWLNKGGKWFSPPDEALKDVVSIGWGTSWAGTVTSEGRLWVWSNGGLINLGPGESHQGEYTRLYSSNGEIGSARLKDGPVLQLNLTTNKHRLDGRALLNDTSTYAYGGYRSFFQRQNGKWISSIDSVKLAPFLNEIEGQKPEQFSLSVFYKGYEKGIEKLAIGLITIEPTSKAK